MKKLSWVIFKKKRVCSSCGKIHTKGNPVTWCDGWHWLCKDCDSLEWATT